MKNLMKKSMVKLGLTTGALAMGAVVLPAVAPDAPAFSFLSPTTVEASGTTSYTTTAYLNLRTGKSTKYSRILLIPKGKSVTYLGASGGWYKVKYAGKTGWVSAKYIKKTTKASAPQASASKTTYKTTDRLNLRTGTSTKYYRILMIPKGKSVEYMGAQKNGWYKVKYAGRTGWVSGKYLTSNTVKPKPTAKPTPVSNAVVKTYATTDNLNMRTGGSTKYKVILKIPKGKTVSYTGKKASTGWYQVTYAGKTGYVSSYYLKAVAPSNTKTTSYPISLNDMVAKQFAVNGQTDAYRYQSAYVRKSHVTKKGKVGTLKVSSPVVDGATTHTFGTLKAKSKVTIVGETKIFYRISYQIWRNAKSADIKSYVDPSRFKKGTSQYYQFLDLSASSKVTGTELNKVLRGKGILNNRGAAFVEAGKKHKVNEVYLVSHALLETGNGMSALSRGIVVNKVDGKKVPAKKVYNMFGIGANDHDALRLGSERAYKEGWTTPEKAIVGGAKYIGEAYVNHPVYKQNTLYKMRWNPERPATHQYATDIGWAVKQTKSIDNLYKSLRGYSLVFDVPKYR